MATKKARVQAKPSKTKARSAKPGGSKKPAMAFQAGPKLRAAGAPKSSNVASTSGSEV